MLLDNCSYDSEFTNSTDGDYIDFKTKKELQNLFKPKQQPPETYKLFTPYESMATKYTFISMILITPLFYDDNIPVLVYLRIHVTMKQKQMMIPKLAI